MASGYLHISKEDIFAGEDGVIYWKNGAKILGEIVSCIDSNEDVHYYLKSTNIKKAILIDAFVPVGVNDYFLYSDSANFINVQIDSEDYSSIGGGDGIAITFLLPEGKYYTIHEIDEGGNLRIFDPSGDGGQIGGGGSDKYLHLIKFTGTGTKVAGSEISLYIVTDSDTPLTIDDLTPDSGNVTYKPGIPSIHYLANAKSEDTKAGATTPLIRFITEHSITIGSGFCCLTNGKMILISSGMDGLEVSKTDISSTPSFYITFTSDTIMKKL